MRVERVLLRHQRGLLIGWTAGLFLYMLLIGASYAAVKDQTALDELWSQYPEAVREAFGGTAGITSVEGYLETQATSLFPILLGILLVMSATRPLCGAEERGVLDHVLARPISRTRYAWAVVAQQATLAGSVLLAAAVGGLLGFASVGVRGRDLAGVLAEVADLVPLALFLLGLATGLGTLFHRRGPAIGLGVGLVLGFFVLEILRSLVDELAWLRWLNPQAYWAQSEAFSGRPDLAYLAVLPTVGLGLAWLAVWRFESKDLVA